MPAVFRCLPNETLVPVGDPQECLVARFLHPSYLQSWHLLIQLGSEVNRWVGVGRTLFAASRVRTGLVIF